MKSSRLVTGAALLSVALGVYAAQAESTMPAALYDVVRVELSPRGGCPAALNPTSLCWPRASQERGVAYVVELSQDAEFKKDVLRSKEIAWCFYNPHRRLDNGLWYWRYAVVHHGKQQPWSETATFKITDDTPRLVAPNIDAILKNLPQQRPYILSYGQPQSTIVKHALQLPELARQLLKNADKASESEIIDLATGAEVYGDRKFAVIIFNQELQKLRDLNYAYLISDNQKYFAAAEKRISAFIAYKNRGMAQAEAMKLLAESYDTFNKLIPATMKEEILGLITPYLESQYRNWVGQVECKQIDNHFWQMEISGFFKTALATVADRPEHRKYLEYAYGAFLARVPVVGGNDGGWANGLGYFRVNEATVLDMAYMLQTLGGADIFSMPWYKNMAHYLTQCAPAGGVMDGFGDMHDRIDRNGIGVGLCIYLWLEKDDPLALFQAKQILSHQEQSSSDLWIQLLHGKRIDDYEIPADIKVANSGLFREVGLVSMHSQPGNASEDMAVYFRSSPYGANGHMHANQNCFNLSYKGYPVFYSSGYYTSFADPHSISSYKHTRAHNGILVDGRGQAFGFEGYGWIKRCLQGEKITYACGDASMAYRPLVNGQWSYLVDESYKKAGFDRSQHFGDAKLKTFDRHIAFLRPRTLVIYDVLESEKSVDWQLLLNTKLPSGEVKGNRVILNQKFFVAEATLFSSDTCSLSMTNAFFTPPVDIRNKYGEFTMHSRATFDSQKKSTAMRFLTIIQCADDEAGIVRVETVEGEGWRVGEWMIAAELNVDSAPALSVTTEGASLYVNNLPKLVAGNPIKASAAPSSLLVEKMGGNKLSISESKDAAPARVMADKYDAETVIEPAMGR